MSTAYRVLMLLVTLAAVAGGIALAGAHAALSWGRRGRGAATRGRVGWRGCSHDAPIGSATAWPTSGSTSCCCRSAPTCRT